MIESFVWTAWVVFVFQILTGIVFLGTGDKPSASLIGCGLAICGAMCLWAFLLGCLIS